MKYMGVHKVAKLISPSTEMSDVFKSLIKEAKENVLSHTENSHALLCLHFTI